MKKIRRTNLHMRMLILALLLINASSQCIDRYYLDAGECKPCHSSCLTCQNGTSCTSCSNRYLDQSTGLCLLCPNDQFYSDTLQKCLDCEGTCSGKCAYRTECFECEDGKYFDLETMKCIEFCGENSVYINDPMLRSFNLCRMLDYYVDPESNEVIELGTKAYPYKSIALPFAEILNSYSHSNRTVNIFIKEYTTCYIMQARNFIMNMTMVNIESYTNGNLEPGNANLFGTNDVLDVFSPDTVMNLVSNSTLLLSQKISQGQFTETELAALSGTDSNIVVHRSNLRMNRINMYRNIETDYLLPTNFLRPVYLQEKNVTILNSEIQVTGFILYTNDPMSFHAENVSVDLHASMGGFVFRTECNYPEAYNDGSVSIHNVTAKNVVERTATTIEEIFLHTGSENYTVTSSYIEIYGTTTNERSSLEKLAFATCNPDDDKMLLVQIRDTYFTMKQNPDLTRYIVFYPMVDSGYIRPSKIIYDGNIHEDIYFTVYSFPYIDTAPRTIIQLSNNVYRNISSLEGGPLVRVASEVLIQNETFISNSNFGSYAYGCFYMDNLIINNITFENIEAAGTSTDQIIFVSINNGGNVTLSDIKVLNSNTYYSPIYRLEGALNYLTIVNSIFDGIIMSADTSLISTGEFHALAMENMTFANITTSSLDEKDCFILSADTMNLTESGDSIIQNITLSSIDVGFVKFVSVVGSTQESVVVAVKDITYSNNTIQTGVNFIEFENILTKYNLTYILDNLAIKNIIFLQPNYLIVLQNQMANSIIIKDSLLSNIEYGMISMKARNKQDLSLNTKAKFVNTTFTNMNVKTGSVFELEEGAELEISNCSFANIYSYEEGSVINAGYRRTSTSIYDSFFSNNTAVQGAVFNVQDESTISVYNSEITNNFAVTSGVIQASNNGNFDMENCIIHHNYALSSSVSQIFDVAGTPEVRNCSLYSNKVLTLEELDSELEDDCSKLCFMNTNYKEYLLSNPDAYSIAPINRVFQLISANLMLSNGTKIFDQDALINTLASTLTVSNCEFYDLETSSPVVTILSSTLNLESSNIYNINSEESHELISGALESNLKISQVNMYDSKVPFLVCLSSEVNIENISLKNITADGSILYFSEINSLIILNSELSNLNALNDESPFIIKISEVKEINNMTITDVPQIPLMVDESTAMLMQEIEIKNCTSSIIFENSDLDKLSHSAFYGIGNEDTKRGGALHLINSNATIYRATFMNNLAHNGGAIAHSCAGSNKCILSLNECTFEDNTAVESGGAIWYNLFRPVMTLNRFINNNAVYGRDIASYAVKVKLLNYPDQEIEFSDVGSGVANDLVFTLALYDHDNQVMTLDDTSQIQIKAIDSESSVGGTTKVKVVGGVAVFDEATFRDEPGATNVQFQLASTGLDTGILRKQYGDDFIVDSITLSFRFCQPGEYVINNRCVECSPGTYSFAWNSTRCELCMNHAECQGAYDIEVNDGYWRKSKNSTTIIECPNSDACLGGFNSTNDHPVNCRDGYDGILCSECVIHNGDKYERMSDFQCSKCPNPTVTIIRFIGLTIAVLLFVGTLIFFNIIKKRESRMSILMRIMTNYFQVIGATIAYSMKFPSALEDAFAPLQILGSSSQALLSYDCFASATQITLFAPSTPILKTFMVALLPLIVLIGLVCLWALLHLLFKKKIADYKRNAIVSSITILFLLHPTLTSTALGMFQCIQTDDSEFKVRIDMAISCYSFEHIKWCLLISLPMIIVWVIGCPLLALIILVKNRKRLDDPQVQRYIIVLYQGFRPEIFYWELVNTLRKVIIVCINVFMAQADDFYKGALAVIVILMFSRIQLKLKPYKLEEYNECENLSFLVSMSIIYSGLIYSSDTIVKSTFVEMFAFVFVILMNVRFFVLWAYLVTKSNKHHFIVTISNILRILLRKKRSEIDATFLPDSIHRIDDKPKHKHLKLRKKKTKIRVKNKTHHKDVSLPGSKSNLLRVFEDNWSCSSSSVKLPGNLEKKEMPDRGLNVHKLSQTNHFKLRSKNKSLKPWQKLETPAVPNEELKQRSDDDQVMFLKIVAEESECSK